MVRYNSFMRPGVSSFSVNQLLLFFKALSTQIKVQWHYFQESEIKKVTIFCLLNFFLAFGFDAAFFSSNAVLVSRIGPQFLFWVYLTSALMTVLLMVLFYLLLAHFHHRRVFWMTHGLFGITVFLTWIWLKGESDWQWGYILVRSFYYAIYFVSCSQFWVLASDYFNNFQAKRRFPMIMAAHILGGVAAGWSIHATAQHFGAVNFALVFAVILFLAPVFILRFRMSEEQVKETDINSLEHPEQKPTNKLVKGFWLSLMLFIFWAVYSFICYGTDYVFNVVALQHFPQENELAAYFGRVVAISSGVVLFYQLFIATPLSMKFGVDRTIYFVPLLIAAAWSWVILEPTLLKISITEGIVYFFIDYSAITLLNPLLNLYSSDRRAKVKALTDGLGRPFGIILLFVVAAISSFQWGYREFSVTIVIVSLAFLFYPYFFKKVYLKYLLDCVQSKDLQLVANAVQALGEKNKKSAARPLIQLLKESKEVFLKRTIVLSLGQMQSRMAYKEIVSLFSVRNESLQLSVLNALSHYKNYECMFLMLRLMRSKEGVTFRIRSNAGRILTKLMGKKMVPFLMESLHSKDYREVANAIESIGMLRDPKTIPILIPYLSNPHHRVKANAIIALYPFRSIRRRVSQILEELYQSLDKFSRLAAIYAIGDLELREYIPDLEKMLNSKGRNTLLQVMTALAKMKVPRFCEPYIQFILDPENPLKFEAAKRFTEFPRYSRWLLFEQIAKLHPHTRRDIYFAFADTPIDLSEEKGLMASHEIVPDLSHL